MPRIPHEQMPVAALERRAGWSPDHQPPAAIGNARALGLRDVQAGLRCHLVLQLSTASPRRSAAGGGGWRLHGRGTARSRGRGAGWDFVHVAADDRSRVAYSEVLPDEKGLTCAGVFSTAPRSGSTTSTASRSAGS